MARGWHEFRDPLHDFIVLTDHERKILDTPQFQRLRRIKQLATTHYVYPGALHSRFEHSLGTMELATRAFDTLLAKGGARFVADLGWRSEDEAMRARQILRLGALLHDIGHPPFSHAPEERLLESGWRHEHYTVKIIKDTILAQVISESPLFSLPVDDIVYIAVGPKSGVVPSDVATRFLGEIVFGDLGVDRIDYLNRDSLHLGVRYGRFDFPRLLNTLTYTRHEETGDPVLAIEEGGVHAAEALLLARYFMFLQVYFHHVRVAYDIHLEEFMRAYLRERLSRDFLPTDLDGYLALSDTEIEEAMTTAHSGSMQELATPFLSREAHFRLALELYPSDQQADPEIFEKLGEALSERFGDGVRAVEPSKETYSLRSGEMLVVGDRTDDIMVRSELIHKLPSSIWRGRFYCKKELQEELLQFGKARMKRLKEGDQ